MFENFGLDRSRRPPWPARSLTLRQAGNGLPAAIPALLRPESPESREAARDGLSMVLGRIAVRWVVKALLRGVFRLRVGGSEHLPAGPFILAARYRSGLDAFALGAALPASLPVAFLADHTVTGGRWRRLRLGAWNALMRWCSVAVPLHRRGPNGYVGALRAAEAWLRRGGVLGIFPEGRRAAGQPGLLPLQDGAALLALRTGVPIVPAVVEGGAVLRPGRGVTVCLGPALAVGNRGERPADRRAALTGELARAMLALLPETEREVVPVRRVS